MLAWTLDWLRQNEGPLAYVLLGIASLVEYVFPPFPGDTVALFGVYLVFAAHYDGPAAYLALVFGAVIGGQATWYVGRRIGRGAERPAFLRGEKASETIAAIEEHFARHGSLFLALHRFVPALRALVFVAAGMSGFSFTRTLVLGALSAALWNGALFALGYLVAASWERLSSIVSVYSTIAIAAVAIAVVAVILRRRARGQRPAAPERRER